MLATAQQICICTFYLAKYLNNLFTLAWLINYSHGLTPHIYTRYNNSLTQHAGIWKMFRKFFQFHILIIKMTRERTTMCVHYNSENYCRLYIRLMAWCCVVCHQPILYASDTTRITIIRTRRQRTPYSSRIYTDMRIFSAVYLC